MNRVLLTLLTSRFRGVLPAGLIGLAVSDRITGHWQQLPVFAAPLGHALIVIPRTTRHGRWWRNLVRPSAVRVCRGGRWLDGDAWVIRQGAPGYALGVEAWRRYYPEVAVSPSTPIIRVIPVFPSPVAQPLTSPGRALWTR
jgi:hypothetical protein